MTTVRQVKGLLAPLLERNPDLVAVGRNRVWLRPVGHIGRSVFVDRTSDPNCCFVSWHVTEFFMPQTPSWFSLGRCGDRIIRSMRFSGGQGWFWSDPTIYQDFIDRVEAEALTPFRSLDTTRKCLEFKRSHPQRSGYLNLEWHVAASIALGEIEAAQEIWSRMRRRYIEEEPSASLSEQQTYRRFRELDRPLRAGDREALCALLAQWEAENIVGTPLEPYWRRSAFPLEDVRSP